MTATTTPAISVRGLRKAFGELVVLDGIDLEVAEGTVLALLGPNGAGKTTTIHILSTLLPGDAGEVRVGGYDVSREPDAVRALIGLTGQVSAVDPLFTGEENLRLMADLRHLGKADGRRAVGELLERFDLVDAARKPVATWSGGMRRRMDLAMTLVGRPRILFLDEPTTGLDPRSRRVMWDIVRGLVEEGATIILTTQYLEEADRLASQVALLDRGRLLVQGTPAQLKRAVPGGHVRLEFHDLADLERAGRTLGQGTRDVEGVALELPHDGGTRTLGALLARLDAEAIEVAGLSVAGADLDDVFLSLTGHDDGRSAAA
jgi:ABC-2 type transport system ATP-binding protein